MSETPETSEDAKLKVLIIEDNAINAKLLTIYLQEAGFEVLHAADGYTGLGISKDVEGINVILLDRMMPDMDGLDVLRELKYGQKSWDVPVIMLTAALSSQQIQEAKMTGAYDCLPKPYNKEKIIATINTAIASRRTGEG